MTDAHGELALLCTDLAEIRDLASEHGLTQELKALLTDIRRGREVGGRRIELMRRLGIPAGATRSSGLRLPGFGDGRPQAERYVCPAGRCSRSWVRPPGDPVPNCEVANVQLTHRPLVP